MNASQYSAYGAAQMNVVELGGGFLSGGVASPQQAHPSLHAELQALSQAVERLNDSVGSLADKLSPLLRIEPAVSSVGKQAGVNLCVPVLDALSEQRMRVHDIASRVNELFSRVAL